MCLPEKAPEMLRLFSIIGRFLLFNKNTDRHYVRHTAFCFQSHLIFKFIFLVFHTKNTASPSFMSLSRLCAKPLREGLVKFSSYTQDKMFITKNTSLLSLECTFVLVCLLRCCFFYSKHAPTWKSKLILAGYHLNTNLLLGLCQWM